MFKINSIGKWLLLMIFVLILSCGSASADDEQLDDSEYDDENLPLTAYEPEAIAEIKKDPQFITSRGSFSEIVDDYEVMDFSNPVYICWSNVTETDRFFSEFEDYVIGFSYAGAGFIIVELESDSSEKVNDATIDEIYQIIDDYCEQEGISEVPVVFMWSYIDEDLPLPDYGPELFEEVKNDPKFIAARGTMPEIGEGEEEKQEWINSLTNCFRSKYSNLPSQMDPYMLANDGPVLACGCRGMGGYLFVEFDENTQENVSESIDEIYQIIEDNCELKGISEVPVVFMWGEEVIEEEEVEAPALDEVDNADLSDEKEEAADDETTNQTPGFTSIMVILGLLLLVKIKRK